MPNYEIVNGFCKTRKKNAIFPATFVAEPRGIHKLLTEVSDCFGADNKCKELDCKYAGGEKDPEVVVK